MSDLASPPILKVFEQTTKAQNAKIAELERQIQELRAAIRRPTWSQRAKGAVKAVWDGMPA